MHWVSIPCTHRNLDEKGTPEISASSRLKAAKGPKCFPKGFREASCRITNKTHAPAELTAELPHSWSFSPASGQSWCSSTAALPLGCPSCLPERKITRPRPPKRTQNPSHVSFPSTSYGCPTPKIRRMNRTDFSMSRCERSPNLRHSERNSCFLPIFAHSHFKPRTQVFKYPSPVGKKTV